tara:strand:- start:39542 stop:39652 length:111 start_codon:yes stop_codon:yes gene_type:complete
MNTQGFKNRVNIKDNQGDFVGIFAKKGNNTTKIDSR